MGVTPVRAFPISAPDEGLSLVSTDGHELLWIEAPSQLPEALRTLRRLGFTLDGSHARQSAFWWVRRPGR